MSGYHFLKPFTFKHQTITLKNRIVIPPMTTRLSFEDGTVTRDASACLLPVPPMSMRLAKDSKVS